MIDAVSYCYTGCKKVHLYRAYIYSFTFQEKTHSHRNGQWKRGQHLLRTVEKQTDNKSHYLPAVLSKRCEAMRWALQISRVLIVGLWLRNQRLLWAVGLRRNIRGSTHRQYCRRHSFDFLAMLSDYFCFALLHDTKLMANTAKSHQWKVKNS